MATDNGEAGLVLKDPHVVEPMLIVFAPYAVTEHNESMATMALKKWRGAILLLRMFIEVWIFICSPLTSVFRT